MKWQLLRNKLHKEIEARGKPDSPAYDLVQAAAFRKVLELMDAAESEEMTRDLIQAGY